MFPDKEVFNYLDYMSKTGNGEWGNGNGGMGNGNGNPLKGEISKIGNL